MKAALLNHCLVSAPALSGKFMVSQGGDIVTGREHGGLSVTAHGS